MRFLLLNQFYPPDVAPTGKYLHDLARSLRQRGHEVGVLCSRRSYDGKKSFPRREILNGVEVVRLPATGFGRRGFVGKVLDYASYYSTLFATLMFNRKRPEVVLSLTTPPYIGLLGKIAAKRHACRHAHWVMDLYPDVLFAHGMTRSDGIILRLLQTMTRFQFRGADCVWGLGPMMAKKVAAYTGVGKSEVSPEKLQRNAQKYSSQALNVQNPTAKWVPLWSDPELAPWPEGKLNPLRAERGWQRDEVVFLYSGNMGLGHRFNEFLDAARQLGSSGPRWIFAGGGKRLSEIQVFSKSNPGARIEILDYAPHHSLRAHLCAADVHFASLDSAWQGLMVPSKIQGSFAVGRPVLYVGGRECEIAAWIQESGGGWIVDEGDIKGLLAAIQQALDSEERRKRGEAAWAFARQHFQMSENCARIVQMLEGDASGYPRRAA